MGDYGNRLIAGTRSPLVPALRRRRKTYSSALTEGRWSGSATPSAPTRRVVADRARLCGGRATGSRLPRVARAAAVLATGLVTQSLKWAVGRPRPDLGPDADDLRPGSFDNDHQAWPSGHVSGAFSLATSVAMESDRAWVGAVAYGLAGVTAWSRIYADRHWTSDVVAGAVFGTSRPGRLSFSRGAAIGRAAPCSRSALFGCADARHARTSDAPAAPCGRAISDHGWIVNGFRRRRDGSRAGRLLPACARDARSSDRGRDPDFSRTSRADPRRRARSGVGRRHAQPCSRWAAIVLATLSCPSGRNRGRVLVGLVIALLPPSPPRVAWDSTHTPTTTGTPPTPIPRPRGEP